MGILTFTSYFSGLLSYRILIFTIWFYCFKNVISQHTGRKPESSVLYKFELSDPPIGLFDPVDISPDVAPHNIYPVEPLPPMYPPFPSIYEPVLTGKCLVNFSYISSITDKTSSDCSAGLADLVGNVICCPQVKSLLRIFQGTYNRESDLLVLQQAAADDCFSDIISILASRGASNSIPTLCSVKSSNLTGGSCPIKNLKSFESIVNTSKLLGACSTVDPLKECCRSVCRPAIMEAVVRLSSKESSFLDGSDKPVAGSEVDVINDCKGVVYAWLSRKLSAEAANTAFRLLSSCKINQACPLKFEEPSTVIKECRDMTATNPSCCSSLKSYISTVQHMLVTNKEAINCATLFGSILQKSGIKNNIFELCDVDLKDFSLPAFGQEGCLLRSLPADVKYDNNTGLSITCDLSDNIAAPWPSSSSMSSFSLCAPEMSLPALPVAPFSKSSGANYGRIGIFAVLFLHFVYSMKL